MKWKILLKQVKSLEDSGLLLNRVTETVQNKLKELKGGLLNMLLGTLVASLLGNTLSGQEINRPDEGEIATRNVRGILTAGYGNKNNKMDF